MKLITPFKSLIQGGMVLSFRISAAGTGENVQLDILPQGKDSATGVALPAKAIIGTSEGIDAGLEEYLQKYATSVTHVAETIANAEAELKGLEQAAAAQARKAVEEKRKSKTHTPAKSTGKTVPGAAPKDMTAGLLDDDDDEGGGSGDDTPAPTPVSPASSPAASVGGMSADLFNL
jgi:PRTRC genetic system protein E